MTTPLFSLPELAAAQAQKHITVNEALNIIDACMNMTVIRADNTNPPASPNDGDKYIPAATAGGDWTGHENKIAVYYGGNWYILNPQEGWRCYNQNTDELLKFNGSSWVTLSSTNTAGDATSGAQSNFEIISEEVSLSGASVDTTIVIPNPSIVFNVSCRVNTEVTGASSFDVGVAGNTSQFGGSIPLTVGTANAGIIGPTGFYAETPIRLTANGSNFTGGAVRVAIHYYKATVPTS